MSGTTSKLQRADLLNWPARLSDDGRTGDAGLRVSRPWPMRRGQSLVEFALVALVVYLLLAAIITFGFILFAAQTNQQIVDVAAREIARTPIPLFLGGDPSNPVKLEEVLYGNANMLGDELGDVRRRVFDEHYLALDVSGLDAVGIRDLIEQLPIVNQLLTTLMFVDDVGGRKIMRYPGTLINDPDASDDPFSPAASGLLVRIPVTDGPEASVIDWVRAIEPMHEADTVDSGIPGPFELTSAERGIVALRVNYPHQSSAMSSFQPNAAGPFEPSIGNRNLVSGASVAGAPGSVVEPDRVAGPYTGPNGLGLQFAFAEEVRPFTKLIVNQAVHRREVFR